jgi:hypothetical protein
MKIKRLTIIGITAFLLVFPGLCWGQLSKRKGGRKGPLPGSDEARWIAVKAKKPDLAADKAARDAIMAKVAEGQQKYEGGNLSNREKVQRHALRDEITSMAETYRQSHNLFKFFYSPQLTEGEANKG